VGAVRPNVELVGKNVQVSPDSANSNIDLKSDNQLPQDALLVFSVRAKSPVTFNRDVSIEVASEDEAFSSTLTFANRGLTLADTRVAVATFEPAKAFGFSAFGPLKFRVLNKGSAGDWQPLATLVRLPVLQALQCPAPPEQFCKLSGANLFLVDAVASDPQFEQAVAVPDGFPGRALPVPRPGKGGLYIKLRDDPTVVNVATLVAEQPLPAPADSTSQTLVPSSAPIEASMQNGGEASMQPDAAAKLIHDTAR